MAYKIVHKSTPVNSLRKITEECWAITMIFSKRYSCKFSTTNSCFTAYQFCQKINATFNDLCVQTGGAAVANRELLKIDGPCILTTKPKNLDIGAF